MAKDPAFLFYPGDASEDTQFMNRLERGCYFDLLKAQKKFKRFTLAQVKKVLGSDFETCWSAIELVLEKENETYFISWVENAITNRAEHSKKQKEKIEKYWAGKKQNGSTTELPKNNQNIKLEVPLENAIENENAIESKSEGEIGGLGERDGIVIYKPEQFLKEVEGSKWIESVAILLKIDPWWVSEQLKIFAGELKVKNKYIRPLGEIKEHFYNWLKIQIEKNVTGNSKNKQTGDYSGRKSDVAALGNAAREHLFRIDDANNGAGNTG